MVTLSKLYYSPVLFKPSLQDNPSISLKYNSFRPMLYQTFLFTYQRCPPPDKGPFPVPNES